MECQWKQLDALNVGSQSEVMIILQPKEFVGQKTWKSSLVVINHVETFQQLEEI